MEQKRARAQMLLAMTIFGSVGLFVRGIELPSGLIALIRGIIGCLFLVLAGVVSRRKWCFQGIRANLWKLLLSGAMVGFNWMLLFEAYRFTSLSCSTLSYYCAPSFVIFLSPLILKERLSGRRAVCALVSLGGMALVAGSLDLGAGSNDLLGIACGLGAALLYACVVLTNKFIRNLPGLETTTVQLGAAFMVMLPYVLLTTGLDFSALSGRGALLLGIVGILHTGTSYLLYFSSMGRLSGQSVAVLSYTDPVVALLLSALILGERMSPLQILGAVILLGALICSELPGKREKQAA